MKIIKHLTLTLGIIALALIFATGCNNQVTASKQVSNNTEANSNAQDTLNKLKTNSSYVGSETCSGCHLDIYKSATHSKHFAAFKPLTEYSFKDPLGEITIYDGDNKENPQSTVINLNDAYGVMMDDYIIAHVPSTANFKGEFYRVAQIEKNGDIYKIAPASISDVNKDGTDEWMAKGYTCGSCHSPGIEVGAAEYGISCETCHGPGSEHLFAKDRKGTLKVSLNSCYECHPSEPTKDNEGTYLAANHYGTRNFFVSSHAQSSQLNSCFTCHDSHTPNSKGNLLLRDDQNKLCASCHSGEVIDLEQIMWTNPTDPHGHITKDHSFGTLPYAELGDKTDTKEIEVTSPKAKDLISRFMK